MSRTLYSHKTCLLFDRASGQAADKVPLHHQEQNHWWRGDQEGGGHQVAVLRSVLSDKGIELYSKQRFLTGQDEGEEELVPGVDKSEGARSHQRRGRKRKDHVDQGLEPAAAIDQGR